MTDINFIANKVADLILKEQLSDERERQAAIEDKISSSDLEAPEKDKDEKERITDEGEEEGEAVEPKPKPDDSGEEEKEKDGEFEVTAANELPRSMSFNDIKDQINNLRAGKSLKDEDIANQLEDYFKKLGQAEERSLFVFLSSLAAILTGGTEGDEAPRPETMGINLTMKKDHGSKEARSAGNKAAPGVDDAGEQAPIVVGEAADTSIYKLRLLEAMTSDDKHRCVDGRLVHFGTKACVKDLSKRIEDTAHSRDSCSAGSANRASLNGTLKYLRQKLRAAQKILAMK